MRPSVLLGNGFVGATPASVLTINNMPGKQQPAVVEKKNSKAKVGKKQPPKKKK